MGHFMKPLTLEQALARIKELEEEIEQMALHHAWEHGRCDY